MLRRTLAVGGSLLVAAALVFLTPGAGHAAPHGGGGFHGGVHVGGFGGYHGGGFGGGYHSGGSYAHPSYGGYHYGRDLYRPYYGGYYGYYPYAYGSYPYYGYAPSYGYSPDYGSYPYSSSDLSPGSVYDPGYSSSAYQSAPSSSGGTTVATPAPADTKAHVSVTVPADAQLWFDDTRTTSTGTVREFDSPPLAPGTYTYNVKASWQENGHEVTQSKLVKVTPGGHVDVNFPVPSERAGQASAGKGG